MKCPICNFGTDQIFQFKKIGWDKREYSIFSCEKCTHRYSSSVELSYLNDFYQNFRPNFHRGDAEDYFHEHKAAIQDAQKEIEFISDYMAIDKKSRILDYGCGHGFFIYACKQLSDNAIGVDPDKTAVEYGRRVGLPLFVSSEKVLDEICFEGKFDIVAMRMVIEHMINPVEEISRVTRYLRDGGLLVGQVPNGTGLASWIYKEKWHSICPPAHLHYFSEQSFRLLLCKNHLTPLFVGVFKTLAAPDISIGARKFIRQIFCNKKKYHLNKVGLLCVDTITFIKRNFVYWPIGYIIRKLNRGGKAIFFIAQKNNLLLK